MIEGMIHDEMTKDDMIHDEISCIIEWIKRKVVYLKKKRCLTGDI